MANEDNQINHLPSEDMVGINNDMLRLCATISAGIYDSTLLEFEELLQRTNPEMNPVVRFYEFGVNLGNNIIPPIASNNPPTFTGVIADSTLILGWRGTKTFKDMLADFIIESKAPWDAYEGLEVQKVYYDFLAKHFRNHEPDIKNYIKGTYAKNKGTQAKDGEPITKIILTGHSLGGGLAQVAHLFLRASDSLANICKDVEIRTVALSAPMTTVLNNPSGETKKFINRIAPYMRNIVFNADVVPRGYGNLDFIRQFVNAFQQEENGIMFPETDLTGKYIRAFIAFHQTIFVVLGMRVQAEKYCHVGKLVYYDNQTSLPITYNNADFNRELQYGPDSNVATAALNSHMFLIRGGLSQMNSE